MAPLDSVLGGFLKRQASTGRMYLPLLILAILGAIFSLQAYALQRSLTPEELETYLDAIVLHYVYFFFEPIIFWGLSSIILFGVAAASRGNPFLGYIMRVLPWGMIPMIVGSLFWSYGRYISLRDNQPPEIAFTGIGTEVISLQEYMEEAAGDPELVIFTVVGCLSLVITWYIWTLGVEYAGDVNRRTAAISTGIITALYSIWKISGVVDLEILSLLLF